MNRQIYFVFPKNLQLGVSHPQTPSLHTPLATALEIQTSNLLETGHNKWVHY